MVICVCVNVKVDSYIDILRQCFNAFEKSALSDHFHELLFQYTENPFDLKQMFEETDDFSKYQFFSGEIHLVAVELTGVKYEAIRSAVNIGIERELWRR